MDDFHLYYDELFADKDYAGEVETILKIFGGVPKRALDIGCGTGNHAFLLAEEGANVCGIDPDPDMIEMARQKCGPGNPPTFFHGDISWPGLSDLLPFNLVISMFNVVNYIMDMADLLDFFSRIYSNLATEGVFIFDCWNGLAALLDPPRVKEKGRLCTSYPNTSRIHQWSVIKNCANVDGHEFQFSYTARLWTPFCLHELLTMAGFHYPYLQIMPWMEPDGEVAEDTWKIMFVCQKK